MRPRVRAVVERVEAEFGSSRDIEDDGEFDDIEDDEPIHLEGGLTPRGPLDGPSDPLSLARKYGRR